MAAAGAPLPLWDKDNVEQRRAIHGTPLDDTLTQALPTLCERLQVDHIWPYLRQLKVLKVTDEEMIRHNKARPEQAFALVNFILQAQSWKYHGLMRAMALTGQTDLIPEGGPDPEVYTVCQPGAGPADYEPLAKVSETEHEAQSPMPSQLLQTIIDHCQYYQKYLMRGHIFAFDGDSGDDYIDIKKLYVNIDPKMKDGHKMMVPIAASKILEKVGDSDPPLVVRLYGQPGDGKTSFTMNIAYSWSIAFMEQVTMKEGRPILKSECQLWTTMVFIKAQNIKTTVEDAILEGLGCKEEDQDTMMAHIKQGKGVVILVEAMDELHDKEAIEELKKYVKKCKKNGGPTVLITCRTDLCCIDGKDFDRFLTLEGFTEEQALQYVKVYTGSCKATPNAPLPSCVVDHVNRHKKKMKAVLSNPLKLHIYCALVMKGEIQLSETDDLNIPKLFRPLEKYLLGRGGKQVTEDQSNAFYRFCMHAILNDLREFPQALLDEFNVVESYHIFMHKSDHRGPEGKMEAYYSFGHETVLEFFCSRYIDSLTVDERLSFLSILCSQEKWKNIQLIVIHLLQDCDLPQKDLIQTMIRIILIRQLPGKDIYDKIYGPFYSLGIFGSRRKSIYRLKQLQNDLTTATHASNMVCGKGIDISVDEVKDFIKFMNNAFDKFPDTLRGEEDLFCVAKWGDNGTIDHVVECLEACPPALRQEIVQNSILPLLPVRRSYGCACTVGGTRWAACFFLTDAFVIEAWCVADAAEVLAAYKNKSTSSDHSLALSINQHAGLWGEPDAAHWSQDEWTRLLLQLPRGWLRREVYIGIHDTAPLTGLLSCLLHHTHLLSQCGRITVFKGRTELAEHQDLINLVQECLQAGIKLELTETTIVTPEGADRDQVIRQVSHLLKSIGVMQCFYIV